MPDLLPALLPYIPPSLLQSIRRDPRLPSGPLHERFPAAVLLADISGFTPLTEALARRGAEGPEELTRLLNAYFSRVIDLLEQAGGQVVTFGGDAVTALFPTDGGSLEAAIERATAAARAIQSAVAGLRLTTSLGPIVLEMRCGVGAGSVETLQVGGGRGQWQYVVAGPALQRAIAAERAAQPGEVRFHLPPLLASPPAPEPPVQPRDTGGGDAPPAALEDILRRFVPAIVLSWLERGLDEWLAVLRPMTVLFIGVGGLDNAQAIAPDALHGLVQDVQSALQRYEGLLNKVAVDDKGTVLLALFGAPPYAHEDDAARAVRCAMELAGGPRQLACGVASGSVFAGPIGSPTRREYTVLGDPVNLASRLMEQAGPGNVLCDFATYRQARGQVAMAGRRPLRIKGKAGLVRVYRPRPSQTPAAPRSGTGAGEWAAERPLVGRRAEVARLQAALDAVEAGEGRVLLIEGEAGIGKSRLVAELTHLARERGLAWLLGAAQSIEQQTPYRAWRDVFSFYLGIEEATPPEERRARAERLVGEVAPDQLARLPLLNDLLPLGLAENELTSSLDPALRQQGLFLLLTSLLRAWARERPLLLILEDAHWLDSLSWELARHIVRALNASGEAFLIVLALRPLDEAAPGARPLAALRAQAETIALRTLDAEDTVALVAARLGLPAGALPEALADLVRRQAGGNPFFAEELVSTLRDQGLIEIAPPHCRVVGDLGRVTQTLPNTVQGLILARIDRLSPDRQLALKMAAVIGRTFSYAALQALWKQHTSLPEAALQTHLDALATLDLTLLDTIEPERVYFFKHIITQEVAYGTLLFAQRRALHRSVAEWYEAQSPGPVSSSPYLPLLVHHYHDAADEEKERRYARLAGEQAAAQFANDEAIAYLSRALELTPPGEAAERYAILLTRARVYEVLGRHERHAQDLDALRSLAEAGGAAALGWRIEVALLRSQYAEVRGDYHAAIAAAQEAIALAEAAGDSAAVRLAAAGHLRWGWALWRQGEYDAARERIERGLALAHESDQPEVEARCHRSLGNVFLFQGMHALAEEHLARALEIYRRLGDRRQNAVLLNDLGNLALDRDDYDAARSCYEQSLAIKREIGDRRGEANGINNLGLVAMDQGEYGAARGYFAQALQICREVGDRRGEGSALGGLGNVALAEGDLAAAGEYLAQGLAVQREIGDRYNEGISLDLLGLIAYHRGDWGAAQEEARQALAIAEELGDRAGQAFALMHLGNALAGLDRPDEADAAYRQSLAIRRELGQNNLALEALAGLARLDMARGDLEAARQKAEEVLAALGALPETTAGPPFAVSFKPLEGTDEPFRILLTCYRALRAAADPRAPAVLRGAHALLLERAARLEDESRRTGYLENIPAHREIVAEFQRATSEDGSSPKKRPNPASG